jgi:hypothetical protein
MTTTKQFLSAVAAPSFMRRETRGPRVAAAAALSLVVALQPARADPTPTERTAQNLPAAPATRLPPKVAAALGHWMTDAYLNCWAEPSTIPPGERYVPEVAVEFNPDGSLAGTPQLVNPPPDSAWRAYADSAVRAAQKCDPLRVPSEYAPYFAQWLAQGPAKTIHFYPRNWPR